MQRTYTKNTTEKIGEKVVLKGWVDTIRDHGKVVFVMLKDITGVVQCVGVGVFKDIAEGYVIEIEGKVKEREERLQNKNIETGKVEIEVESFKILAKSKELPIPTNTNGYEISEESRLKYRFLDMRRDRVRNVMKLRAAFSHALRQAMIAREFTEIETPMLGKATKEGARDFIVPSRYNPGKFYALPQSPQQYKQLLMVAGLEKYFQLARCIRDEDLRADRGYEFTQLDIEMSFVTQEEVRDTMQDVLVEAIKKVGGKLQTEKFPVLTYAEVMEKYGSDKFDIRSEKEKKDGVLAFAWVNRYPFFKKVEDKYEEGDSKSGWVFTHNPFSSPIPEHKEMHLKGEKVGEIVADQYDLVCNGYEIGSGGIRANDPELLKATYKIMGYSEKEIEDSIGHMLSSFEFGAPPHGGVAFGIERLVMLLANEVSLKEVVPFPMTASGKTAISEAPSEVSAQTLEDLHIALTDKGDETIYEIRKLLDENKVEYKFLEHEEVRTSEQAAKVRGTKLSDGAKAMIVKSTEYMNKYAMIVIPADVQLSLEKVSKILGEKYEVAPKADIEKYTGIQMGGVPPFGRILHIETYFDKSMFSKTISAFNCGRKDRSMVIATKDLIKYAQPNKISSTSDFVS
ncbi:OB-fold nucleic acid binding domain-containing protein [Candidatus Dojkabacteria bacterium]|jgi:aspartyl-tRNA synthetase|nr:OB-fold nucleic acid binding domain-containing protein [Candidatus Dojkabacteria bacterium]